MYLALEDKVPKYLLLSGVFVLAFFYLYYDVSAQNVPSDFSINCEVGCSGPNNDRIECLNKTTNPSVDFTWSQSTGATSYQVYYKNTSIGSWVGPVAVITNVNNPRYVASVGLDSQNHYYIRAVNSSGFKSCSINFPAESGGCKSDNISYTSVDTGAEANCQLPPPPPPPPQPPPPPPPGPPPPPPPP
ncbi:MAG: hypothetical protein Q8R55_04450, partial [Candidatus Taylorbacteria bacterium]|nr:hypothetical protein [Candidatus Taylorbacteria bacterium]